jgi:hypothetical protein
VDAPKSGRIPTCLPRLLSQSGSTRGRWIVSPQQPEDSEIDMSEFGRMLLDASESELQEVVDEALRLFSTPRIELLRECKALVDARLAAEPESRVFSISNPHVIRLRQWREVSERLAAEINFRSGRSTKNASVRLAENPVRPGAQKDPAVAARRTLVRQNAGIPDKELCDLLDREEIRPPRSWQEAGSPTWVGAWRTRQRQIHVIFSKDRKPR